ncbi:MAG: bifunctional 5,10-methylene-tetrahydrofolate dehydrogenase/5,10-methylene-tetrahydrofolate cyclohydrolase [Candidatus Lokiarchaeota archaeon]|nr:bifunctional 5,10-methylene-tetrahydrofolate dehydrogenase/5,10-methylene-tetrahydrofolate cyclohydrolase [Candidatus Lokiarchaeota archaeon]MBD3199543.1 bifunctional 5,10-methylene-tetrahydrofolate dehydrogenase/5,10-methylene-tetrahydrofolate cyclohydrolase [Candidatus Lokiarchaeota archaeon]
MTIILDGRKLASKLNSELSQEIKKIKQETGHTPSLATILVGTNPASEVYIKIKHRTCQEVGINSLMISLDENISSKKLIHKIEELNKDDNVHAILLQLPLPEPLRKETNKIIQKINPSKDVDGFSYINRGKLFDYKETLAPCTPKGIITLLEHYDIEIESKNVTIINRSNLVGKPLIFMFLNRNATITICHSKTKNIENFMKQSDILIVAVGHPNFITKEKIKEGVVLIDVGTNRVNGKLCGDVNYDEVFEKAYAITPNPGGIGPMTVASLMQNTLICFKNQFNS